MTSLLAKRRIRHDGVTRAEEMPDEDLLAQYLTGTSQVAQESFRAIIERHGPMVLGVCRYVLNQDQDAEDAFQATFLVLARKATSIRNRRVLAGWLHEIAYRIAIKSRASTVRRRNLEREGMAMAAPASEPDDQGDHAAWNELRPVLHEEINRLPDKYRIPVILSYLEGKTNEEVAEQLRWPLGTVKGRLSRARDLLRSRLTRRGLALSAAFLLTTLSRGRTFAESVPTDLIQKAGRLATTPGAAANSADSPSSPDPDPAPQLADLAHPASPMSRASRKFPRRTRLLVITSLFLGISFSLAIGTCMAVLKKSGGHSGLTATLPTQSHPRDGSCR
ncbi:MAG: RNA polymerase sigma factor [Isosphaeraceae bacterium]